MYTAFFGLRCLPFEDRPDVRFFYPAAEHEEAVAAMQYEVQHGAGVGLVVGDPGAGKTTVLRALLQRLTRDEKVVVVNVPGNGATDIVRESCKGFGVSLSSSVEDARGLARLRRHFSRTVSQGHRPVLIIDQAEHMSPADLADVECLVDLHDERGRLLRVILVADPHFRTLLDQPVFSRFRQLAFTEHSLTQLSRDEVFEYIRHRLKIAGAARVDLFSEEAIDGVLAQSQGVPRVINQVCNAAMLAAFGAGDNYIAGHHVVAPDRTSRPLITVVHSTSPSHGGSTNAESPASPTVSEWNLTEEASEREAEVAAVSSARINLEGLIHRAHAVAENLQHRLPRSIDAMEATERRVSQMLADARHHFHSLETRLAQETARADQAALRLERAEQVSARAEQLEARLSAFAEQLTDQMDQVQSRVAEMMKFASPLDDARTRLEGAIRQAESSRSKMEETIERGVARITRQNEESKATAETAAGELLESAGQRVRQLVDGLKSEVLTAAEKAERSIKAAAAEGQRRIAQSVTAAQGQSDATLRSVSEQVAMCDQKITHIRDAAECGERTVQAAIQKAVRQSEELKQSGEQLRQSLQSARDASEQLRTLQTESSKSAARFEADATEARQICEHMAGMTVAADQKIGQLASVQAATAHLHERVGKLLTQAHPTLERADQTMQRLAETLSQCEEARAQMNKEGAMVAAEAAAQLERMHVAGDRAEQETSAIAAAVEAAGQVLRQLSTSREHAIADQNALQKLFSEASSWTDRMESFQSVLAAADNTAGRLGEVVSAGSSLTSLVPELLEETQKKHSELSIAIQALESLFRGREQAERSARQTIDEAGAYIATIRAEIADGEQKLGGYHQRAREIESQLEHMSSQAADAREVSIKLQSAVDDAHAQSENLERVCVAVRKVFAGLSQATLSARRHAQEVEDFLKTANETAASLRTWLERVRVHLEGAISDEHTSEFDTLAHRPPSNAGTVAQAAELSLEGEPGAEHAHLVAGGFERAAVPAYGTQAREISELIEKARQAKDLDYDTDLIGQDAR